MASYRVPEWIIVSAVLCLAACDTPTTLPPDHGNATAFDQRYSEEVGTFVPAPADMDAMVPEALPEAAADTSTFTFRTPRNLWRMFDEEAGVRAIYEAVLSEDINGDGLKDVIGLTSQGALDVFLKSGDGILSAPYTYNYSNGNYLSRMFITAGEFNRDGITDIAFSSVSDDGRHGLDVLLSKRGQLPSQHHVYTDNNSASGYGVVDVVSMDADGDGIADLVLARNNTRDTVTYDPSIDILSGDGHGQFSPSEIVYPSLGAQKNYINDLVTEDVDGDGFVDLVFSMSGVPTYEDLDARGRVMVAYRAARGLEPAVELHGSPAGDHHLFYADINGDTRKDAVVGYEIHLRNRDGSFGPARVLAPFTFKILPSTPALADFDGDGLVDLINRQFDDSAYGSIPYTAVYLQREGTLVGTLRIDDPPFDYGFNVGYHRHVYASDDINGDGCRDFIAAAGYAGIVIMEGMNCMQRYPRMSRPLPPQRI